jgi:hypothetical protein
VEDGVCFGRIFLERLDSLCRGQDKQFDAAALGFLLDFIHDGQRTGSEPNWKPPLLFSTACRKTYVRVDRDLRFTFTNQMAASASRSTYFEPWLTQHRTSLRTKMQNIGGQMEKGGLEPVWGLIKLRCLVGVT